MRSRCAFVFLAVLLAPGCSRSPVAPEEQLRPTITLSERLETEHLIFHYSPGDFVDVARNEAFCQWASSLLGFELTQKIDYYKWKDRQQEWLVSQATNIGFGGGYAVITYLPWMNHELFHSYQYQMRPAAPSTFFVEGMAVAYQVDPLAGDFVPREKNGVPLHDVVREMKAQGRLLPLSGIMLSFKSYDYTIAYDEAGSFIRYLIDTRGLDQLRSFFGTFRRYTLADLENGLRTVYGKSVAELEQEWLAFLG